MGHIQHLATAVIDSFNLLEFPIVAHIVRVLNEAAQYKVECHCAAVAAETLLDQNLVLGTHQDCLDRFVLGTRSLTHVTQQVQRNANPENEVHIF